MVNDFSYEAVMSRRPEIMKASVGIDYSLFEHEGIGFDYERMMKETGYTLAEMQEIQGKTGVGNTPLLEMHNMTALSRKYAKKGKGARIFIKDEAAILPAALKPAVPPTRCIMPKNWATKASSQPPAATTAPPWPARQPCTG
jgi:hypothetical protein